METTFNLPLFMRRLAETIAWCNYRLAQDASPDSLRTVLPAPDDKILLFREYNAQREQFIENVFANRHQLLQAKQFLLPTVTVKNSGRLVIFLPDCAYANDGVAELESQGFFDRMGYPAWDTWIYTIDEPVYGSASEPDRVWSPGLELIGYVPAQFIDRVQNAINANPDEAIFWLKDLDFPTPYKIALQNAGFL